MTTAIHNQNLLLTLEDDGKLTLTRLADGLSFQQQPLQGTVSKPQASATTLSYTLTLPAGTELRVSATLPEPDVVDLTLSSPEPDGEHLLELPDSLIFPAAWQPVPGDTAILPLGEGAAVPVDDAGFKPHFNDDGTPTFTNVAIVFTALLRGNACLATALLNPCDVRLRLQRNPQGLATASFVCLPSKQRLGYPRTARFFLTGSLSEATQKYRAWREQQHGWVVTLKEKQRRNPEVGKLIGAADIWLWDDNNMNWLYGRPEQADVTPRDPLKVADELLQRQMTDVLWNAFEGETPETCAQLKQRGFLVGKYDIYRDVLPAPIADLAIPYRKKRSVNTKYWPDIVRVDPDGSYAKAWQIHTKDGQMHHQHSVCDLCALKLTMENVPPDVARVGYTSRLIDVQAGTGLCECHSPHHPTTRADSLRYINAQNRFLADIGLVVGVEVGQEGAACDFHYSEGLMSPVLFRAQDAGRRMCTLYQGDEIPAQITDYMLNPVYRVPLWELIYHDCTVSYWYWGDSSNSCPDLMPRRDLFNALYGLPPLYSLNMTQWEQLKDAIASSYHRATPVAKLTGYSKMTHFQWLADDKLVQQTTFDNNVTVVANFSYQPAMLPDGTVVAPQTAFVRHDDTTFTIDCNS